MQPRTRRVQRIHLAQPIIARLGASKVVVVDVSILGARVEHHTPLIAGSHSHLTFEWEGEEIAADCRIVRSRLERFSVGTDGLTVYHSGLEFEVLSEASNGALRRMIGTYISRALEEQKLNARGILPQHDPARMPIFRRGGQLTANRSDLAEAAGGSGLPVARMVKDSGYVCYHLDNNNWRKKRTHDPGQPSEGFTISALEDDAQVELLCDAYARSDRDGRRLIQLFAQLSIVEGKGLRQGGSSRDGRCWVGGCWMGGWVALVAGLLGSDTCLKTQQLSATATGDAEGNRLRSQRVVAARSLVLSFDSFRR